MGEEPGAGIVVVVLSGRLLIGGDLSLREMGVLLASMGGDLDVEERPGEDPSLRRGIDLGYDVADDLVGEEENRPADGEEEAVTMVFFPSGLSAGRSDCQSIPCCCFSWAKFCLRASRSSFDLAIFSGWWYRTGLMLAGVPRVTVALFGGLSCLGGRGGE